MLNSAPPSPIASLLSDPTRPTWQQSEFREGAREMVGVALGIAAWGLVTGVAMVKSGMTVPMALFMSLTVFAGSAQLATVPLIAAHAPVWVILATALCVNLRFVIFSAGWRPYFAHLLLGQKLRLSYLAGDLNYVIFMRRYPQPVPQPGQWAFFWGGAATNWTAWQIPSVLGVLLGDRMPAEWGLGFAGTLALIGLTCTMLVDRATWVAAVVAACAAVAAYALPLKLNILVAIAAAISIGVLLDHRRPSWSKTRGANRS